MGWPPTKSPGDLHTDLSCQCGSSSTRGIAFLFASDVLLPRLVPAFPTEGAWIGQLLGAAWLGVAALNWSSQSVLLGGIYGRPVVLANGALYFITTLVLLRIVLRSGAPPALWLLFVPGALLVGIYSWLLLRGPFERDSAKHSRG